MRTTFLFLFLLSCSFCQAQISNDGLLAYYNFENNVNDQSGNSYNGTLNSGNYITEGSNTSLLLNGIDDYLDISIFADTLRDNLNELSIFFRVKFLKKEDNQTILSLGNAGESTFTNVFEIEYEKDRFQIETETSSNAINNEYEIDQTGNIFTDEWIDVLILLKGDTLTYCRNGIEIFKDAFKQAETTTESLFVGCFGGDGLNSCCFFGGQIDDLQFYNRILAKDICENDLESQLNFEICKNEVLSINNIEYTEEGLYVQNLLTSDNCDSILYITIDVKNPAEAFYYYNGCMNDGYEILVDGTIFNEDNPTGLILLTAINNCDSIINVDLNYNNCFDCDQIVPNLGIQVMKDNKGSYELMYGNSNYKNQKVDNLDLLMTILKENLNNAKERRPNDSQPLINETKVRLLLNSMKPNSSIKL